MKLIYIAASADAGVPGAFAESEWPLPAACDMACGVSTEYRPNELISRGDHPAPAIQASAESLRPRGAPGAPHWCDMCHLAGVELGLKLHPRCLRVARTQPASPQPGRQQANKLGLPAELAGQPVASSAGTGPAGCRRSNNADVSAALLGRMWF